MKTCFYGIKCNKQHDAAHCAQFTHREGAKRPCKYGQGCYKRDDPAHNEEFFHVRSSPSPSASSFSSFKGSQIRRSNDGGDGLSKMFGRMAVDEYTHRETLHIPPTICGHVLGKQMCNITDIMHKTGAHIKVIRKHDDGADVVVRADAKKSCEDAVELVHRWMMNAPDVENRITLLPHNPHLILTFVRPDANTYLPFVVAKNNSWLLKAVDDQNIETNIVDVSNHFSHHLPKIENFAGRIKFQCRFGAAMFYDGTTINDAAAMRDLTVDNLQRDLKDRKYTFVTAIEGESELALDSPIKTLECLQMKGFLRIEGKRVRANFSVAVQENGNLHLRNVSAYDKKICAIDQLNVCQNVHNTCTKPDLRFSLQTSVYYMEGTREYNIVQDFVRGMKLVERDGQKRLLYVPVHAVFVRMIRHKVRTSYEYQGCRIDISKIRLYDCEEKYFDIKQETAEFVECVFKERPHEVEVSLNSWRDAFKYNKQLAEQNNNSTTHNTATATPTTTHTPWKTGELLGNDDLKDAVDVAVDVVNLLYHPSSKKGGKK